MQKKHYVSDIVPSESYQTFLQSHNRLVWNVKTWIFQLVWESYHDCHSGELCDLGYVPALHRHHGVWSEVPDAKGVSSNWQWSIWLMFADNRWCDLCLLCCWDDGKDGECETCVVVVINSSVVLTDCTGSDGQGLLPTGDMEQARLLHSGVRVR